MNLAHQQQCKCNMQQIQEGPLKLQLSPVIKLVLSPTQSLPGTRKFTPQIFKGHLQIVNNGRQLVTYKVMSKVKAKVEVRPAYGFIGQGETITLSVSAKNAVDINHKVKAKFSIVILATSCIVIDEVLSTHWRLFWNNLLCGRNITFVEVLQVNKFHFYNTNETQLIAKNGINDEVDPKENDNDSLKCDNNSSGDFWEGCSGESRTLSSCSSVSLHQADYFGDNEGSDASGDSSSHSFRVNRRGNKIRLESIGKLIKPSRGLIKTHSTLVKVSVSLLFCFFVIYLALFQRNMRKVEFDILITTSKLS